MRKSKHFLAVLMIFSLVLLVGCVQSAKQKKLDMGVTQLGDQELQALFSKPLSGSFMGSKGTSTVQYMPDGTQTIQYSKGTDKGKWRIANGEQCSKWTKIRSGSEKCATWFEIGPGKYEVYNPDGSKNGTMTFK